MHRINGDEARALTHTAVARSWAARCPEPPEQRAAKITLSAVCASPSLSKQSLPGLLSLSGTDSDVGLRESQEPQCKLSTEGGAILHVCGAPTLLSRFEAAGGASPWARCPHSTFPCLPGPPRGHLASVLRELTGPFPPFLHKLWEDELVVAFAQHFYLLAQGLSCVRCSIKCKYLVREISIVPTCPVRQ